MIAKWAVDQQQQYQVDRDSQQGSTLLLSEVDRYFHNLFGSNPLSRRVHVFQMLSWQMLSQLGSDDGQDRRALQKDMKPGI